MADDKFTPDEFGRYLDSTKQVVVKDADWEPDWFWQKGELKPVNGIEMEYPAWLLIRKNEPGEIWEALVKIGGKYYSESENYDVFEQYELIPYKWETAGPVGQEAAEVIKGNELELTRHLIRRADEYLKSHPAITWPQVRSAFTNAKSVIKEGRFKDDDG